MPIISTEQAKIEINAFMDAFKVDKIKQKKIQEQIDVCVELVEIGSLIVENEKTLRFNLQEPICDDSNCPVLESLRFKNRKILVGQIKNLEKLKENERLGEMFSMLTGENKAFVDKLTCDDLMYFNSISSFFLPAQ